MEIEAADAEDGTLGDVCVGIIETIEESGKDVFWLNIM